MFEENLVTNAEEIENFLEDDLSRRVFRYRLFANLTGDVRYIYRLMTETGIFSFEDALNYYKKVDKVYHIYPKYDVLSFIQSRSEERPIVLFGAGKDAENYYSLLNAAGITPVAVIDNYTDRESFFGIPVCRPGSFEGLSDAVVVITSRRNAAAMYWELIGRGVAKEQIFIPYENALHIFSMREYFDDSVWTGRENEIFVDAGAYNLHTSYDFTKFVKSYEKIYAFEPDVANYQLCERAQEIYNLKGLELIDAGLWDRDDTLYFSRGGDNGTGTFVSEIGTDKLQVRALDRVLNGAPVTLIKMDIEGSELMALKGAEKTIRTHRPRLAICLYHKPMDIIEIPLYIKELVPEYKMKIRHYSTAFFDTVLYAYV